MKWRVMQQRLHCFEDCTVMNKYEVLKKYFGYDSFRPGQETMIDAILEGRDALGIMPTGAGKSICYQVPALMLPGITLVISPLISLMMDQVKALNQAGIHAAFINSSLTEGQIQKALQYASQGRYQIIYVAPERLETESFLSFARNARISMITVDEAHCISQWGQDFRPSYLKIVQFIENLPVRPIVSAFTATATREVKEDIICVLGLKDPEILITGFDRENLYFEVRHVTKKDEQLLEYVTAHSGDSGIIYCATRKNVENVCAFLEDMGIDATRYHAGLTADERKRNQEDFIYDVKPVMVATNAFGMGIDKSNVRYVIHYNMPQSLENYYQEAGRAGRDGEPSECIILYSPQDVVMNQFLIENGRDSAEMNPDDRELILERDRERLKKMTYYCFTNDCLRDYILRYFGEYGNSYCGNCVNCRNQFETVDVTEIAQILIGCVQSSRQRYGVNVILDTVHGANTAKIRGYHMDRNPCYGKLAKVKTHRLRNVMNYLLLENYLTTTNDEYITVKLTERSLAVLEADEKVVMKMAKEQETAAEIRGGRGSRTGNSQAGSKADHKGKGTGSSKAAGLADLDDRGKKLFERLRTLRMEIAREEKVPPYIVFSDKTLVQMCITHPLDKASMLQVSGVGEFKYEKYGERFLKCLRRES